MFTALRLCAAAREIGLPSNEKLEEDISFHFPPSPKRQFIISFNNTPRAATANNSTNTSDTKSDTLNAQSCLNSKETIEQKELLKLKEENAEDARPELNDPIKQFTLVFGHAAEASTMPKEDVNA